MNKWNTKEVVVIAMIGVAIGVFFTLMDFAYMPLSAMLGVVFMELTFGIYLLSASLSMYIVRRPGAAIFGALVTAGVNLLLGSPYGVQLVLAASLQALGVEIGYALCGAYQGNKMNIILASVLAALFVFSRDIVVFGTLSLGLPTAGAMLLVRLLSAVVINYALMRLIVLSLGKTGVLKGFACMK